NPADAAGIRPAGQAGAPPARRARPGAAAGRSVGLGRCGGQSRRRQPHQGAAPQAGRRPHPHRARCRLRARGAMSGPGRWHRLAGRVADTLPRPLDRVRSIKLKLAVLMLCSGGVAFGYFRWQIGWLPPRTTLAATAIALLTSQVLAHGITRPLREMTAAAKRMAHGDYSRRVRASSRDEVGELAEAFNQMAADLAAADRQRR